MLSVAIGAACNIILDPIFIFLLRMGVSGAALATVISQAVSCIWIIRFLSGKKTLLRLKREYMKIDPKVVLPCVALGTATFIMQASESVISVCFNSSLLKYGGDLAVGAMTILTSVMGFAMMPLQGLGQGAQPISSYNYGAGNVDRVKKTFRLLLICSLSYSVVLWVAVQLAPQVFVGIFSPDPTFVAFASKALKIYLGGIFLFGIQIACQMTFTSMGKAVCSIIVAVVRKFVLLLPLIYLMPRLLSDKTSAVYMAEPVADIIAVTFTAVLFYFQFRKAMAKLEKK
jgi:putative MATE family efflux protein